MAFGLQSLSGCNVFDPRSDALACSLPTDCDAPRVCESGYCVIPGALLPDADPAEPDADPSAPDADTTMIDSGTPLPDADPGSCSTIALLDDFADGLATPLWDVVSATGITVTEAGGVLTISAPTNPPAVSVAGYHSVERNYVFTNSSFFVEVPTMVNTAGNAQAKLVLSGGPADSLNITQIRGNLDITLTLDGGLPTVLANLSYSPTAHRWWRVSDSEGNFRVQTSPDGIVWTDRATGATPAFFSAIGVDLEMFAIINGAPPGDLVFDNANGGGVVPACP